MLALKACDCTNSHFSIESHRLNMLFASKQSSYVPIYNLHLCQSNISIWTIEFIIFIIIIINYHLTKKVHRLTLIVVSHSDCFMKCVNFDELRKNIVISVAIVMMAASGTTFRMTLMSVYPIEMRKNFPHF